MSKSLHPSLPNAVTKARVGQETIVGRGAALALLGLLALPGCKNGALDPNVAAAVAKVCAVDAQAQPMVAANAPLVEMLLTMAGQPIPAGGVAAAVAVDQAGVHAVVVKACAAVAGSN